MVKKSNMYDWITKSWNPLGGSCPHDCSYCYVKSFHQPSIKKKYSGKPFLIHKEVNKPLSKNHLYFVCSMIDLFAQKIPSSVILKILEQTRKYPKNTYLFQTKNPERMKDFQDQFPRKCILGTTIESDKMYDFMGKTPCPIDRALAMNALSKKFKTMITIEPIVKFDPFEFWNMICIGDPSFVNIGADSKKNNLPEPSKDDIKLLIKNIKHEGFEIKIKPNLKRLL